VETPFKMVEPGHSVSEEELRLTRHMHSQKEAATEQQKAAQLKQKIHNWEATHAECPLAHENKDALIDACSPRFKETGACCGSGKC
jgi:hypothetical protein